MEVQVRHPGHVQAPVGLGYQVPPGLRDAAVNLEGIGMGGLAAVPICGVLTLHLGRAAGLMIQADYSF